MKNTTKYILAIVFIIIDVALIIPYIHMGAHSVIPHEILYKNQVVLSIVFLLMIPHIMLLLSGHINITEHLKKLIYIYIVLAVFIGSLACLPFLNEHGGINVIKNVIIKLVPCAILSFISTYLIESKT